MKGIRRSEVFCRIMESQKYLFSDTSDELEVKNYWKGMPEYNNVKEGNPEITATFKFKNKEDFEKFQSVLKEHLYGGQKVFDGNQLKDKKSTWYPLNPRPSTYYYDGDAAQSKYPIYIISKGRWDRRQTVRTLEYAGVDYRIVVEPSEYEKYAEVVDNKKILRLPSDFSELGQGSVPVRNWVWEHSIIEGHEWHWILDDNLESIERYNDNMKVKCKSPAPFRVVEEFVSRYSNIGQAGMHYANFCPSGDARPPIQFNSRIYSCILIRNDIPFRWRGKYNEDTDLSLRILKSGLATVNFRAFLVGKRATLTQKGGNENIYSETDDRLEFAKSLESQHPDVVTVVRRFGRWHHQVNYRPFKFNTLNQIKFIEGEDTVNNHSLMLKTTH